MCYDGIFIILAFLHSLSKSTIGVNSPSERLRIDSSAAIVVSATKMSLEIVTDIDEVSSIVTVVITHLISHSLLSSAPSIITIVITCWLIPSSSIIAISVVSIPCPLIAQASSAPPRQVQVAQVPPQPRQPRVLASVALSAAS